MASIEFLQNEVSWLALTLGTVASTLQMPISDDAGRNTLKDVPTFAAQRMLELDQCRFQLTEARNELARVRKQLTACRNKRR